MSIESDDLHKPLGLGADRSHGRVGPGTRALVVAAAFGMAVAALGFLARDDERAGEPYATAKIAPAAPESVVRAAPDEPEPQVQRSVSTGTEVENDSGVTVIRPGGAAAPDAVVIRVPDAQGPMKLAAAPDPRLVERSEFGSLPRIGADGARPARVYARPAPAASSKGHPRIAILIGGVGLNEPTTAGAIGKLPAEVSLAFAPYGTNLKAQAARARDNGHEILLQVPMEPFDYPQNNPGPQTLTIDAGAAQNLEKLHWAMGRASGFIGIENFQGARLTAEEAAITPILRDLADRGLIFVDDGSSARSIAPVIAASLNLGARRADLVIDAVPNAAAIDAALARLEALARERGVAMASGSALPITIERLSAWAAGLAGRGIDLVPVSATVNLRGRG